MLLKSQTPPVSGTLFSPGTHVPVLPSLAAWLSVPLSLVIVPILKEEVLKVEKL